MYAIMETGGKQYRVQEGDTIYVEKLDLDDGAEITIESILAIGDGAEVKVGTPFVAGATVTGKVLKTGKGKKIMVFKYKSKKNYRRRQGHRQPYTKIEIMAIKA